MLSFFILQDLLQGRQYLPTAHVLLTHLRRRIVSTLSGVSLGCSFLPILSARGFASFTLVVREGRSQSLWCSRPLYSLRLLPLTFG